MKAPKCDECDSRDRMKLRTVFNGYYIYQCIEDKCGNVQEIKRDKK